MKTIIRYEPSRDDDGSMDEYLTGRFVSYDDYMELSDYADRLVAHKDMICLPMDLQLLRESNLALAIENHSLKTELLKIKQTLISITYSSQL